MARKPPEDQRKYALHGKTVLVDISCLLFQISLPFLALLFALQG
jgi:hypothetical protein